MNHKLKLGIIGAGAIVENSHLPVLQNISNIDVNWIYDQRPDRSKMLSKMYGVASIDENRLDESLNEIDICLLTIPYGARPFYIQKCASLNKALYVEKPFAVSLKEHLGYDELFPPHKLAIGFQRRYYRMVHSLQSIIASNLFGKLKEIRFSQGYFSLKGGKSYLSNASLSGGGVIIESAIHTLDQVLLITGTNEINLQNLQCVRDAGIDYDSKLNVELITSGGNIPMHAEISTLRNLDNGLDLYFDQARVHCIPGPDPELTVIEYGSNISGKTFDSSSLSNRSLSKAKTVAESFYIFWSEFINAMQTGGINLTSAGSSVVTTGLIEKIYSSIRN